MATLGFDMSDQKTTKSSIDTDFMAKNDDGESTEEPGKLTEGVIVPNFLHTFYLKTIHQYRRLHVRAQRPPSFLWLAGCWRASIPKVKIDITFL